MNLYTYKAKSIRVIDGDTINLNIDLGFRIFHLSNCRLYGINAPEVNSNNPEERRKAVQAKQFVELRLPPGIIVDIISRELDKYGRPLVEIFLPFQVYSLNSMLVSEGLAKPYLV